MNKNKFTFEAAIYLFNIVVLTLIYIAFIISSFYFWVLKDFVAIPIVISMFYMMIYAIGFIKCRLNNIMFNISFVARWLSAINLIAIIDTVSNPRFYGTGFGDGRFDLYFISFPVWAVTTTISVVFFLIGISKYKKNN
ncbi:hypothetical protein JXA32_07395 [Candidatus Sumerlaeota bacterium]|nr:hypothetical protein [Candidatus Sumerlaeota bacterium]